MVRYTLVVIFTTILDDYISKQVKAKKLQPEGKHVLKGIIELVTASSPSQQSLRRHRLISVKCISVLWIL